MSALVPHVRTKPFIAIAVLIALLAVLAIANRPAAQAAGPIGPIALTPIGTPLNRAVGIDYHEPSNKVIMSVNYPNGLPYNFELVAADGSRTQFSSISGLTDEVKIATVRSGPCQGGFATGEFFTGNGAAGEIVRVSADGLTVQNPWVTLPGEGGLMRGSLFQDQYCVAGGDLIAVTTAGGVWRITAAGTATKLAQIPTHLEGVSTIPDDPRYGPWAGKILIGAEAQTAFWIVDPDTGDALQHTGLAIRPEDIDIVPAGENFFGVNYPVALQGAPASAFNAIVGDLVVAQESPGTLFHVWWDGTQFQKEALATVSQWEHVTFAPAGVIEILPVFSGDEGSAIALTGATNLAGPVTATWTATPGAGVDAGATCTFGPQGLSTTVTCTDDGTYDLTLTVTDGVTTLVSTTTLEVANVAPTLTLSGATTVVEGQAMSLLVSVGDPGTNDSHVVEIDWGDGSPTTTVTLAAGDASANVSHVYVDDNPTATPADLVTISATVQDDDGGAGSATHDVTVQNAPPADVTLAVTPEIDEGESVTASGSFSDAGVLDSHTVVLSWGDGSPDTTLTLPPGVTTFSATHQYLDDDPTGTPSDTYTVSIVSLTDDDGGVAGVNLGGNIFLTGHDPDFHAQGEAGAKNLLRAALDFATSGTYDDGPNPATKFLWVESRIPPPPGHRVGENGLASIGLTLGVDYDRANAAELPGVNFNDYTAIAVASGFGGLLTRAELDALIARSTDIRDFVNAGGGLFAGSECDNCGADLLGDSPPLFGFVPVSVSAINASPPFSVTPFGSSLGLVNGDLQSPTHNSFADPSVLQVVDFDAAGKPTTLAENVRIDDGGLSLGLPVIVHNVAPTVTVTDAVIDENGTASLTVTVSDPGTLDTFVADIDWGDGNVDTGVVVSAGANAFSHQYLDDDPTGTPSDAYTVSVTVTDDDTGVGTGEGGVIVNNLAPSITGATADGFVLLIGGSAPVTVSGTYSDVGTLDTHTLTVAWGDGDVTTSPASGGAFSETHAYTTAGVFTITVTLSDDDTGTATVTLTTTVSATGRMTGGGKVVEPGADKKAAVTHGFQVRLGDDGVAGGEVEYNDHRNGDTFHSTSISSVVLIDDPLIDPGAPAADFDTAIVEGVGRLNGVDGVRFVMTVTDAGEPGGGDVLRFEFPDGESAGIAGPLSGGNHQAHGD